jgi:hypothetical protein
MEMIRKAIATLLGVVATWASTAIATGGIAWDEWWGLLAAVGATIGVYAIPNEPAWLAGIQKSVAAFLGGVATWATTALVDGHLTHDEWLGLVTLAVTTYAAYQALNRTEAAHRASQLPTT